MPSKAIEVKLYTYHDMDLVALYKSGMVSFPEVTKQILKSYANKEVYRVRLLKPRPGKAKKYNKYKKYFHYYVHLDSKEDQAAIALLEKISSGHRNNFIKSILRQYLCGVFTYEFSADGDIRLFREMSNLFQGNREVREIKSENPLTWLQKNKRAAEKSIEKSVERHAEKAAERPVKKNTERPAKELVAELAPDSEKEWRKKLRKENPTYDNIENNDESVEDFVEDSDDFDDFLSETTELY